MKRILGFTALIFILNSCVHVYFIAPRYLRKKGFDYRYTTENTDLGNRLNIKGYFTQNDTINSGHIHSGYTNMMFFDDGMFMTGFYFLPDSTINKVGEVVPYNISRLIEDNKNGVRNYEYYMFYENSAWGYYKIFGDTIKAQYIFKPVFGGMSYYWQAYETWFKIINNKKLVEITTFPISKMSDSDKKIHCDMLKERLLRSYNFKQLDEVPHSDGWIKYDKWFWKDETDYKKWKKEKRKIKNDRCKQA